MKRLFLLATLAGLFILACNHEGAQDAQIAFSVISGPCSIGSDCEALQDTLDSLNRLLYNRLKAGDAAIIECARKNRKSVVARSSTWPVYTE